jgi:crotonobetainyl-CoA:carnitine CoA-transferase CaiB-like acyl-CoA transferase
MRRNSATVAVVPTSAFWWLGILGHRHGADARGHFEQDERALSGGKAKDGYFVMGGATNQRLWIQLCNQIGRPDLIDDERFEDNPARLKHREVLIEELEKTFATKTSDEWVDELLAVGIPAGKMSTYPEAFESEHGQHRKMRIEVPHPIEGTVPNIGFAVKLMGTPQQIRMHPPLLGEHTDRVLAEIGLRAQEIADLRARGAFGE